MKNNAFILLLEHWFLDQQSTTLLAKHLYNQILFRLLYIYFWFFNLDSLQVLIFVCFSTVFELRFYGWCHSCMYVCKYEHECKICMIMLISCLMTPPPSINICFFLGGGNGLVFYIIKPEGKNTISKVTETYFFWIFL